MKDVKESLANAGDAVMKAVGALDQATEELKGGGVKDDIEPEEVGHWITTIGKALMAIFKP